MTQTHMETPMQILITAGGTTENLDAVRLLTNISTGTLGAALAEAAMDQGHNVTYIHGKDAKLPRPWVSRHLPTCGTASHGCTPGCPVHEAILKSEEDWAHGLLPQISLIPVTSVSDLMDTMKATAPDADVIIHAMAVSDFTFDKPTSVKVKSTGTEAFLEHLRNCIKLAPKVLSHINGWNPRATLVSFKLESGIPTEELIHRANQSGLDNHSDLVFANDITTMNSIGTHAGFLFRPHTPTLTPTLTIGTAEVASLIISTATQR